MSLQLSGGGIVESENGSLESPPQSSSPRKSPSLSPHRSLSSSKGSTRAVSRSIDKTPVPRTAPLSYVQPLSPVVFAFERAPEDKVVSLDVSYSEFESEEPQGTSPKSVHRDSLLDPPPPSYIPEPPEGPPPPKYIPSPPISLYNPPTLPEGPPPPKYIPSPPSVKSTPVRPDSPTSNRTAPDEDPSSPTHFPSTTLPNDSPPPPSYIPPLPPVSPLERYGIPPRLVPDNFRSDCFECKIAFTPTVKRYHCKCCGTLFCNTCTAQKILFPKQYGYKQKERICGRCLPKLLHYAKEEPSQQHVELSENETSSNDEVASDKVYVLF